MQEIAKKLKISYNGVYYSLQRTAQTCYGVTRIEREVDLLGRPKQATRDSESDIATKASI